MTDKEAIAAVRADEVVGRGTCSVIDECWEPKDILYVIKDEGITTVKQLIAAVRETHEVHMSMYETMEGLY